MEPKLTAKSKTKFQRSGKVEPAKTKLFDGKVITALASVRLWAGNRHKLCSFSPLKQGTIVAVCDAIQAVDGSTWYYIKHGGEYGFVEAKSVKGMTKEADSNQTKFIRQMDSYHAYVRANSKHFKYGASGTPATFAEAKKMVEAGKAVPMTCVVPIRWGLNALGIKADKFYADDGEFRNMNFTFTKHLKHIKSGKPIGMTVKQAVEAKLLKAGDICGFYDLTHTFAYSGKDCICYDGGHAVIKDGHQQGIKADYSKHYKNCKISEILRWKD